MIHVQLEHVRLTKATLKVLTDLQTTVDGAGSHSEQAEQAGKSWKGKNAAAFEEIERHLLSATPGKKLCCYCEYNESGDVEHIFPKSLFPWKTFDWTNYIFACERCNRAIKGAQFAVFEPVNGTSVRFYEKKQSYARPSSTDSAFVDPRTMNPMDYLFIDLKYGVVLARRDPSRTRDHARFENTNKILQFNSRDGLRDQRVRAASNYREYLESYIGRRSASNLDELLWWVKFPDEVDRTIAFSIVKATALAQIKNKILLERHPTVWKEMKRQRKWYPELKDLFSLAPEALTW
jgi:hypothetical protein